VFFAICVFFCIDLGGELLDRLFLLIAQRDLFGHLLVTHALLLSLTDSITIELGDQIFEKLADLHEMIACCADLSGQCKQHLAPKGLRFAFEKAGHFQPLVLLMRAELHE